jgi:LysM repeat protein
VNNAPHSRRLLLMLVLLLTLGLVACERPLNGEEQPTVAPETQEVPQETQPEVMTPAAGTEETGSPSTEEPPAPAIEVTSATEEEQSEATPEQPAPTAEGAETTPTEAAPTEEPTAETPTEPAPTEPPAGEQTHVVQPGENLFRIGLAYGCSYQELADYNGITDPDSLSVGQVILIPADCGG